MLKYCLVCGEEYKAAGKQAELRRTCSRACLSKYKQAEAETKCTQCEKMFHMKEHQRKRYKRTQGYFCSKVCSNLYKRSSYQGEANPNNKYKTDYGNGYCLSHSKYGKIAIHKLLTLEFLELEQIPEGYVIHHRDCNKSNNNLDNLVLITNSDHCWLHKNFGNASLKAYCEGLVDLPTLSSWCKDSSKAEALLPLNLISQKQLEVFKLGELSGKPYVG